MFKVKAKIGKFEYFIIEYIPREQNQLVDILLKMGSLDGRPDAELAAPTIEELLA